jgi:hypothetical protein
MLKNRFCSSGLALSLANRSSLKYWSPAGFSQPCLKSKQEETKWEQFSTFFLNALRALKEGAAAKR